MTGLVPPDTESHTHRLANGLSMHWLARGPRHGPTAILLHGFPELAVSWRHQFAGLSHEVRLIAPDLRGYGGTDAPSRDRDYAMPLLVGDIIALIDAVGCDRVHLVGHDWGAALAWEVARAHPDRLLSLSTLNCPPQDVLLRVALRHPVQLLRSWYMVFFQIPWLAEWLMRRDPERWARRAFRDTAATPAVFDDAALAPYVTQIRDRGMPGIRWYRAAFWRPSWRQRPVDVPTRFIWGLQDPFLVAQFADPKWYAGFTPQLDVVRIPDAGHWVQQEAAVEVNAALEAHWSSVC